ncbi:hypothetical protein [Naumannella halotolerans]|nr:hypothetical protein [Naumannella halotolerans]
MPIGPDAGDETTEVTVTVGDDTDYTATVDADPDAVVTGVCLSAQGETDDTGAMAASTIAVSESSDGECSAGMAGPGMGARGGGVAPSGQATS